MNERSVILSLSSIHQQNTCSKSALHSAPAAAASAASTAAVASEATAAASEASTAAAVAVAAASSPKGALAQQLKECLCLTLPHRTDCQHHNKAQGIIIVDCTIHTLFVVVCGA